MKIFLKMLLMEAVLKQYKTFQVNEIMTSTKKLRNTSLVRDDHQTYVKKIVKSFQEQSKEILWICQKSTDE